MPALVRVHPLGAWVCLTADGLVANPVPFVWERTPDDHGRLIGHVARANPVWRLLGDGAPSVVMFQGPQAYVTPSWYPGKAHHGEVVPTWDYAVVHVHGTARAVHQADDLLAIVASTGCCAALWALKSASIGRRANSSSVKTKTWPTGTAWCKGFRGAVTKTAWRWRRWCTKR